MVAILSKHDTKWVSPSPLWSEFSETQNVSVRSSFQRPAILRFNNDSFMDELLALMQYYPERLVEWLAQPETWREPMPTPATQAKLNVAEPLSALKKSQTEQLKRTRPDAQTTEQSPGIEIVQTAEKPLKLYQPAHQRFYLVTASLVCRRIGLPDRLVDLAKQQKVEFVVRRLLPKEGNQNTTPDLCNPDECDEYAYIVGEKNSRWEKVKTDPLGTEKVILDGEERLPMFNLAYEETEERKRRMLAGFIPAGKREAYLGAATGAPADEEGADTAARRDAITHLFSLQVAGPWKNVITMASRHSGQMGDWNTKKPALAEEFDGSPPPDINADTVKSMREKIQTTSWYILVDLIQFFEDYIPNVYLYIKDAVAPASITSQEQSVYDALASITLETNVAAYGGDFIDSAYHSASDLKSSLVIALRHLIINSPQMQNDLDLLDYNYDRGTENVAADYSWPDFLFPLADPLLADVLPSPRLIVAEPSDSEPEISHDQIDALTELVRLAIPDDASRVAPDVNTYKPPNADRRDGWFLIRCVFETPNCGPIHLPIVSESTVPFKIAAFFDPDAPGRQITIPMPLDVSPAGLRKFNKNASFMISDMLCGKLKEMRKYTLGDLVLSVLPWPFHKGLSDPGDVGTCKKGETGFGMICSLSIPIVTLCAMILLIIMVTLFNIFFRWLPLLFLCFPVPGLKGKKDA